jgi:hypothetical protein
MSIVSPIGFVRTAVKAQLADAVKGLNPNLVTYCAAYGVTAWSFDFTASSRNFFEANVDYPQSEETDIPQKNLLTLYGGRIVSFRDNNRMMGTSFSGTVEITADMYIGVLGERIQKFEGYVDAATAAMLATMNDVSNQSGLNRADPSTRSGKVYNLELDAAPGQCKFDGENWIVPVRFTMGFGVVIP